MWHQQEQQFFIFLLGRRQDQRLSILRITKGQNDTVTVNGPDDALQELPVDI